MMPEIIDLTLTYDTEMQGVSWEPAKTLEKDGWNARWLHFYSHAGTHMDAPVHFGVDKRSIDGVSLSDCMGRAWIVDVPPVDKILIKTEQLKPFEDRIAAGDIILFRTGWSRHYKSARYRDLLPRISEELAYWLVDRKIKLVGVEPPSVADVNNIAEVTLIHKILLKGNVIIVEGLTNLNLIKSNPCTFMAFPLKIKDGDGAPARALAIENFLFD